MSEKTIFKILERKIDQDNEVDLEKLEAQDVVKVESQISKDLSGKEGLPEISVDIFYSGHFLAEDIIGLERAFEKADIYAPETIGWTPENLAKLRALSAGDVKPDDVWKSEGEGTYFSRLLEMIYSSKKPIIYVDIPRQGEIYDAFHSVRWYSDDNYCNQNKDFDFHLVHFAQSMRDYADWQKNEKNIYIHRWHQELKKLLNFIRN